MLYENTSVKQKYVIKFLTRVQRCAATQLDNLHDDPRRAKYFQYAGELQKLTKLSKPQQLEKAISILQGIVPLCQNLTYLGVRQQPHALFLALAKEARELLESPAL
ncbi:MAG: hypothetical protein KTR20_07935 [Cellvibrionaceae bacterium]|nr:hypothetical protein [Cellvibrionaceae bacterium]